MILFGYGLAYYVIGLFIRQPRAQVGRIVAAGAIYAIPLVVLAIPAARKACAMDT